MHVALAALPLACTGLAPGKVESRLTAFGIRRLGEVLKLPRAGLGKRLGSDFLIELARVLGEIPDPKSVSFFPQQFRHRLELNARVEDAGRLNFCCPAPDPVDVWLAGRPWLRPASMLAGAGA
ncbi:MAG: hypothetical protein IPO00_17295 [Betaproteobacteria bacterium]|nr:hypothetical protein [Betaproteobacteria bacterium]